MTTSLERDAGALLRAFELLPLLLRWGWEPFDVCGGVLGDRLPALDAPRPPLLLLYCCGWLYSRRWYRWYSECADAAARWAADWYWLRLVEPFLAGSGWAWLDNRGSPPRSPYMPPPEPAGSLSAENAVWMLPCTEPARWLRCCECWLAWDALACWYA